MQELLVVQRQQKAEAAEKALLEGRADEQDGSGVSATDVEDSIRKATAVTIEGKKDR